MHFKVCLCGEKPAGPLAACVAQVLFTLAREGPKVPFHRQWGPALLSRGLYNGPICLILPPAHPKHPTLATYLTLLNWGWRDLLDDL